MTKDYYRILDVGRDASGQQIAKAYRLCSNQAIRGILWYGIQRLAKKMRIKHFINFARSPKPTRFSRAVEFILIVAKKRAFYDKYGEEKLKEGYFTEGEMKGGYQFKGNPFEIFENFYGTNNIFSAVLGNHSTLSIEEDDGNLGSLVGFSFGAQNYKVEKSIENLKITINCTLNELYCGCAKTIDYQKQALNRDGITTSIVDLQK